MGKGKKKKTTTSLGNIATELSWSFWVVQFRQALAPGTGASAGGCGAVYIAASVTG